MQKNNLKENNKKTSSTAMIQQKHLTSSSSELDQTGLSAAQQLKGKNIL